MNRDKRISQERKASVRGMRIVIAGGGTGGHLFPGIAIAEAFKRRASENQVLFITTGRPIETRVLSRTEYKTARIPAAGIKGKGIFEKLKALAKLPAGILASVAILIRFRPDVVIGMGAYSAAPVLIAAWLMGIFRVIHEQNRIPGMTNRFLARYAHRIYVSFPDTEVGGYPDKIRFTGNPIRLEIAGQAGGSAPEATTGVFTILILGGSQGAHAINSAVINALEYLDESSKYRFIHQTGTADVETVSYGYEKAGIEARVESFFDDMAACYKSADLTICRAGATSVAEVATAGLAAIFIPYPYAADNHQYFNAKSLVDAGAAEMMDQAALDGPTLAERINYYATNTSARRHLQSKILAFARPGAADEVAEDICRARGARKLKKGSHGKALSIT